MDISHWLQHTAECVAPAQLAYNLGSPGRHSLDIEKRNSKGKRRRKSRDSSLLESAPQRQRTERQNEACVMQTRDNSHPYDNNMSEKSIESSSSRPLSAPTSGDASSSSVSIATAIQHRQEKRYERRPRHKTRADKYSVKQKSSRKKERKHGECRRNKRKKESAKIELPGRVRNFEAKNVANSRLTLNPSLKAGLFRQGRASYPTRGKGLPDLVFSEMNFLKKRDTPAEHHTEDRTGSTMKAKESRAEARKGGGGGDKKSKKDRSRIEEQEISDFFGPRHAPDNQARRGPTVSPSGELMVRSLPRRDAVPLQPARRRANYDAHVVAHSRPSMTPEVRSRPRPSTSLSRSESAPMDQATPGPRPISEPLLLDSKFENEHNQSKIAIHHSTGRATQQRGFVTKAEEKDKNHSDKRPAQTVCPHFTQPPSMLEHADRILPTVYSTLDNDQEAALQSSAYFEAARVQDRNGAVNNTRSQPTSVSRATQKRQQTGHTERLQALSDIGNKDMTGERSSSPLRKALKSCVAAFRVCSHPAVPNVQQDTFCTHSRRGSIPVETSGLARCLEQEPILEPEARRDDVGRGPSFFGMPAWSESYFEIPGETQGVKTTGRGISDTVHDFGDLANSDTSIERQTEMGYDDDRNIYEDGGSEQQYYGPALGAGQACYQIEQYHDEPREDLAGFWKPQRLD